MRKWIFVLAALLLLTVNAHAQDKRFYIFLAFGQSNMEGFPGIEDQDKGPVDGRFQTLAAVDFPAQHREMGHWYTANPPLARPGTGLGPSDYFGRTLVSHLPADIKVGIVNVSVAGCKIELFEKDHYAAYSETAPSWMKGIIASYGGNPYQRLVDMAKLAQKDGVIKGILLHQGESNTNDREWPQKVKVVYDSLIKDLDLKPEEVPLLAGELVGTDQNGACGSMNAIIDDLPKTIPNSYVISSAGCACRPDHLHFTPAGYRELGTRFGTRMLSLLGFPADSPTASPSARNAAYLDSSLSAADRAKDLVSRMTTAEKIAQTMMDAPAIPRLGVPKYHYWSEALHGIANDGYATVFPQAIALASTWDPELMHSVATVISTEARAKYAGAIQRNDRSIFKGITLWSPNVNIFRDPRWGRGQETYGEDPFLTSRMGVAFVTGIQGDDPRYLRAVSTPKHFAVHSGPEPLRHGFDARVTEKELRETYLPAFEACVREGKAASVMSAYSGFNGVPATGNPWLLTTLLRDEWGFDGAVVSDVDSVGDILYGHHAVKDLAEASAMAIKAGNDECSGGTYQALGAALSRGLITEADIDRAVTRLFTLRFRLGMFDSPEQCPYNAIPPSENDTPDHEKLALKAAQEGVVLLKNDGILPLAFGKYKHVAILGPVAKLQQVLVGNYNGTPARPVTILDGIQRKLESQGAAVQYVDDVPLVSQGKGVGMMPRGVLFQDDAKTAVGLKGEVFDNPNLEGTPIATRTDRFLNLHWSTDQMLQGVPNENVSLRWTGYLIWPSDQNINLGIVTESGVRLYLDDQNVLDQWGNHASHTYRINHRFLKGVPVKIRLEFTHGTGPASLQMGSKPVEQRVDYAETDEAVRNADLVILTLGITPQLEGEQMPVQYEGFVGGDRTSILLPAPQRDLLRHVSALGKPVVVVLASGSALSFDPSLAKGVLLQWYSGEQGGAAVADALVGDVNPSGRLPVTFYRSDSDLPAFDNYHMDGRTYRYFKGKPLYPFGYGLSYARFGYGTATSSRTNAGYVVTVPITNTSKTAGDEVVQVYARYGHPTGTDPIRRLVGFKRVSLGAGESRTVPIDVTDWALRSWNESAHRYEVRPDSYTLEVGPWAGEVRTSVLLNIK